MYNQHSNIHDEQMFTFGQWPSTYLLKVSQVIGNEKWSMPFTVTRLRSK